MTVDQLLVLMEEAARNLVDRTDRPHPVTIVTPLPGSTKVLSLEGFPDDDAARKQALSIVAANHMVPENAACFGLLAEATGPGGEDLLVAVYGARHRGAFVTAAILDEGGLGEFAPPEPLDPDAMPFIQPLQHAADMSEPPDDVSGVAGLPIIG